MMIDLHTHSTASDGTFTPEALVDLAAENGLRALALTDHDTLSGLPAAGRRSEERGLLFIPGVELDIEFSPGELHLLGLGIRKPFTALEQKLEEVRKNRNRRNLRMIAKMKRAGIGIPREELEEMARGEVLGRAHFARALLVRGIVSSVDEAFTRYLAKGKPFYEARTTLGLNEAIGLIRTAGGMAVLAHPYSLKLRREKLEEYLRNAVAAGLQGLEAYHPDSSPADCGELDTLARNLGLFITAGSDFHGENRPERMLGRSSGGLAIADAYLEPFLTR